MSLDGILDLITKSAWVIFAVFTVLSFVRTARQRGVKIATRNLFSFRVVLPLLLVLSLSIISASLVFIQPQEVGVVISILAPRGIRDQPLRAGLHWIVPLAEEPITYPIYWQTYTMSSEPMEGQKLGDDSITARTSDGQEVSIDCSVIFRIDSEQMIRVHVGWQDRYIQDLVRPMMRGIVRTEVSQFKVNEVNSSKRRDLEAELDKLLRETLEDKGFILDRFVLRNIAFSPEYAASVEQKQVALEGATRKEHEANQIRKLAMGEADRIKTLAEAEAEAVVTKSQGEAEARVIQAKAEAEALQLIADVLAQNRDLLTYEYIDKLSPGIKVMLLPHDTPFILPLPTLDPEETALSTATSIEALAPITPTIPTETPTPQPGQ